MEPDSFLTDSQILSGCQNRDKRCWDLFVERYSDLIYWAIYQTLQKSSLASDPSIAEDIFQSVFVKLLEQETIKQLKESDSIKKYLVVTASNAAQDRIRMVLRLSKKTTVLEQSDWEGVGAEDAIQKVLRDEKIWVVSAVLESLNPIERKIVTRYYLKEETFESIARHF